MNRKLTICSKFKLAFSSSGSPIRSYDAKFCVLPGSGGCSPDDETVLKWRGGSEACSSPEAQFVFDVDHGTIIHKCSGKSVCPAGGSDAYGTRIVISSKCPANAVTQGFRRTICMLYYSNFSMMLFFHRPQVTTDFQE